LLRSSVAPFTAAAILNSNGRSIFFRARGDLPDQLHRLSASFGEVAVKRVIQPIVSTPAAAADLQALASALTNFPSFEDAPEERAEHLARISVRVMFTFM